MSMEITMQEIVGHDGGNLPILSLSRQTKDALAAYCQRRWPTGRRKAIAREWDLSDDQARSVVEAKPSGTTIDQIWKHPRGGWRVLLPVMGAVIGKPLHEHLRAEIAVVSREQEELEAHARLAELAHRRVSFPRPASGGADRRLAGSSGSAGEDRDEAGAVGSEEAGRLGRLTGRR
ncbi:MAG: hypothetical protein ACK4RV_10370 [Caulobacter sp.]